MLVGALIFVLGIDLVKEALWDSRHRASRSEYLTIMSIMVCMTLWDFVIGVLFGIVICCTPAFTKPCFNFAEIITFARRLFLCSSKLSEA